MPFEGYAVHTQGKPLSMYDAALWSKCFPDCFPYGDGVFGLPRETTLTFQEWASLLLLREELDYQVDNGILAAAAPFSDADAVDDSNAPARGKSSRTSTSTRCRCRQCSAPCMHFTPPRQPRWGRSRDLLCCLYDSWRRMTQIQSARAHVRRHGYQSKLEKICNATADKVEAARRDLLLERGQPQRARHVGQRARHNAHIVAERHIVQGGNARDEQHPVREAALRLLGGVAA